MYLLYLRVEQQAMVELNSSVSSTSSASTSQQTIYNQKLRISFWEMLTMNVSLPS